MRKKFFCFICLFSLFQVIISCKKNELEKSNGKNFETGVFIANEGNFMYGNASLSFYHSKSKTVENNIFSEVNALPLGDVAQSITLINDEAFIVVNNSGKIYIIDSQTGVYKGKITGLVSPRYILHISDEKAYVSDLYARSITIVNHELRTVTGKILVDNRSLDFPRHATEQMILHENFVYVNCYSFDNKILKIDAQTDEVVDSIEVIKQPQSIAIDKQNRLWVLSDGGFPGSAYGQTEAGLSCVDLQNFEIIKSFRFSGLDINVKSLCTNPSKDTLYFVLTHGSQPGKSGIYRMSVESAELPGEAFLAAGLRQFYSMACDSETGEIYAADAKNYLQAGDIYRFNAQGLAIDTFRAGIIPGSFCFKHE